MTVNGEIGLATNGNGEPLTLLRPMAESTTPRCQVCVVGAGPSGLMLASNLVRLGIQTTVIDERPTATPVGRADGLQPKTLETLRMMRLGDRLMRLGTKVYDICMWASDPHGNLVRSGREVHYPASAVDLVDPYILLCHQGMVEAMFVEDLRARGVEVQRSTKFASVAPTSDSEGKESVLVGCKYNVTQDDTALVADYVVGCDGAHSQVRRTIPEAYAAGTPHDSLWGVLDGEVETDFPDLWSKTVVHTAEHGSILVIPRERNKTRLYIEIKGGASSKNLGQEHVMQRAAAILAPYRIAWRSVEWFGRYQVAQRVANRFIDPSTNRVFLAGDASHAHSPKAAQGMNTSMHDAWNLAWKFNLVLRGLASDALLQTYEEERKKIAHDLIDFDVEHANEIASGDAAALAANFRKNVGFIAGVGVNYAANVLNMPSNDKNNGVQPGWNLPPAKVTRYIDANPVDIQTDIPALGQFKVYLVVPDVATEFLGSLCASMASSASLVSRLSASARDSYAAKPRTVGPEDDYHCPERYTAVSDLFTFALITSTDKNEFEIAQLPPILANSPWTVYLDDVAALDTQGRHCIDKWLGGLESTDAAIVNVRPDGYVGSVKRFASTAQAGVEAAQWMDAYYGGFLQVPA
ncbi:hypothetical protein SBRCBS47491_002462 [Sporothrix bragantina]|uniref:FAD binding domain-containing protein n=1 Tax=Sporothrix bragantina TaxID=671064 RepID=A0ABP0B7A4_9PEZI